MDVETRKQLISGTMEETYDLLTRYRFARNYVAGKSVLDICWRGGGQGRRLLAGEASSVEGLTGSPESEAITPTASLRVDASYRRARLPELPHEDGSFDSAVSFGVIEKLDDPEALVLEAKRVLKENGVFIVSTPDKQAHSNDRNHGDPFNKNEMYAQEFKEMLERHFAQVDLFRQGSVAGGFVFPLETLSNARVESTHLSEQPLFGGEPPTSLFVLAVCSDSEERVKRNESPYLLLDRSRRIFEECGDLREDVELLRNEIERMQETEVQAFQDAFRLQSSEGLLLKTRLENYEAQIERLQNGQEQLLPLAEENHRLRRRARDKEKLQERLEKLESSRAWRLLGFYRRLRARLKT